MNHHEGSIESTLIIAKAVISALSACDKEELNEFVEDNSLEWSLGENQSWMAYFYITFVRNISPGVIRNWLPPM